MGTREMGLQGREGGKKVKGKAGWAEESVRGEGDVEKCQQGQVR